MLEYEPSQRVHLADAVRQHPYFQPLSTAAAAAVTSGVPGADTESPTSVVASATGAGSVKTTSHRGSLSPSSLIVQL